MTLVTWIRQSHRRMVAWTATLLLLLTTACSQPAMDVSESSGVPAELSLSEATPMRAEASAPAGLQGTMEALETSLLELNEKAATSLDAAADETADTIQATTVQLQKSLKETAEKASESLNELNQEAAEVLDQEMNKAAEAINAEVERATKIQPTSAE